MVGLGEHSGRSYARVVTVMLGGDARPLGVSVQFLEAPEQEVVAALPIGGVQLVSTRLNVTFARALGALLPFQTPSTRMVTAPVGRWTVLANNAIGGGDPTSPGPRLMLRLGVRCVIASHSPRYGPGHAQTQLQVMGPGGEPPLMYIRVLSCTAGDGLWEWYEWGHPLPFEETDRYRLRHKRDRFDRSLLLSYLDALEIPTDDHLYGPATLHQQVVTRRSREVTFDEARAEYN